MLALASVGSQIGDYLSALIIVYLILLIVYLITNMIFAFGARPGYSIWSDRILTFLREVSEPYLRVFRRFIPSLGPIDLSPTIAIILLLFLDEVVRRIFNA